MKNWSVYFGLGFVVIACGSSDGGSSSGGNTSGGNTSGGNTSGGNTSGGNTSGGNTSSGNTSGGASSSGSTPSIGDSCEDNGACPSNAICTFYQGANGAGVCFKKCNDPTFDCDLSERCCALGNTPAQVCVPESLAGGAARCK